MPELQISKHREHLRRAIETRAFVSGRTRWISARTPNTEKSLDWYFNLRQITLDASILDDIAALFWDTYADKYPFQVGGMETAAIPLITGLVAQAERHTGHKDMTGFYIRKTRKKDGLMQAIEGVLKPDRPVILVDDLMNSGKSLIRQVEIAEKAGLTIAAIWVLVRFRDLDAYSYFTERGIEIHSVFCLNDFAENLGMHNIAVSAADEEVHPYQIVWTFSGGKPSYQHVVPKSAPAIDADRVYMGTDDGTFFALDQSNGSVAWKYQIGFQAGSKGIFSSPLVHDDIVYFGGYDGTFYALNAKDGTRRWIYYEADWIGSSPAIAADLGLIFIGLEFGLWRKRGGIAAIDVRSGRKRWWFHDIPSLTHSSPLYIREYQQVIVGSNDGCAYLFDARSGKLIWKFETGIPTRQELDSGFSAHDIKGSFAYDASRDLLIFGCMNGTLFFVERKSGKCAYSYQSGAGFYATPIIHKDTVLASSLDKHLYCIDIDTRKERWRWNAGARIFAAPIVVDGSIYIGANSGRLTELDPATGKARSYMTFTERITNPPTHNPQSRRFFVSTFANEVYCIKKITSHGHTS